MSEPGKLCEEAALQECSKPDFDKGRNRVLRKVEIYIYFKNTRPLQAGGYVSNMKNNFFHGNNGCNAPKSISNQYPFHII